MFQNPDALWQRAQGQGGGWGGSWVRRRARPGEAGPQERVPGVGRDCRRRCNSATAFAQGGRAAGTRPPSLPHSLATPCTAEDAKPRSSLVRSPLQLGFWVRRMPSCEPEGSDMEAPSGHLGPFLLAGKVTGTWSSIYAPARGRGRMAVVKGAAGLCTLVSNSWFANIARQRGPRRWPGFQHQLCS